MINRTPANTLHDQLLWFLELDAYLEDQGIFLPDPPGATPE